MNAKSSEVVKIEHPRMFPSRVKTDSRLATSFHRLFVWFNRHITTYNILQHITTYYNILQHITTYYNILQPGS